jgi:hypothetical protein
MSGGFYDEKVERMEKHLRNDGGVAAVAAGLAAARPPKGK